VEIALKCIGLALMAAIAVLQFFLEMLQHPNTRWIVFGMAAIAVICFAIAEMMSGSRQKRERLDWQNGQLERDQKLLELFVAQTKADDKPTATTSGIESELGMSADDPRIYLEIKEPDEAMFQRTPFVLTNHGHDVAHKVEIEMPVKLKGSNVTFEEVEVIPAGQSRESMPTIEDDSLFTQHSMFYWLMQDWNVNSRHITEEWPKPLTVRYSDFGTKKFEASMTLVFYPIKYMLKSRRREIASSQKYKTWDFKDIKVRRVA